MSNDVFSEPFIVENVNQTLIETDNGDPIAIIWMREDGILAMSRVGEKDFSRIFKDLGLNKRIREIKL